MGGLWAISTHGGKKMKLIDAVKWAKKMEDLGSGEIMLTSMDKDGTKDGYDIELTKAVSKAVSIPVIASGGAGNLEHFMKPSNMERLMQSLQHLYSITGNTQLEKQKNTLGPKEFLLDFNQTLHKVKGRSQKLLGKHCSLV